MAKTWFITGCSSGFGADFVRQLRATGDNVIATGRNADRNLAHLKDTGAAIMELDVTAPEDVIAAKFNEAWDIYPGGIDVLVNNAGFVSAGAFEDVTEEKMHLSMKTMFYGPLNLTRAALAKMRPRNAGTLLYVSSMCSRVSTMGAAPYCASKHALAGAIQTLALEMAFMAPGIKIIMAEPGLCRTELFRKAQFAETRVAEVAPFAAAVVEQTPGKERAAPGDPTKCVKVMIDLVNGTGGADGRRIPLRVVLGSDGLEESKSAAEIALRDLEEWAEVANSTDRDDYVKE